MVTSIFTDISLDADKQVGGFAFYIGCKTHKIQKAGVLKIKTNSADVCEAVCICNAIHTLIHAKIDNVTHIVLHTDSLNLYDIFVNDKPMQHTNPVRPYIDEIRLYMIELCIARGWKVRDFKRAFSWCYVKGHTYEINKHAVINHWCDTESRKYMYKATGRKPKNKK